MIRIKKFDKYSLALDQLIALISDATITPHRQEKRKKNSGPVDQSIHRTLKMAYSGIALNDDC